MPPNKKFQKEDIIAVCCDIVEEEGFESLNARRIARKLGSSVQPIFHNFASMKELNKEVYKKIYDKYKEYMLSGRDKERAYKEMGLSYIRFAKDYPNFFKLIFMQNTNLNANDFILHDDVGDDVIKTGQKLTGLSFAEQKNFHLKVWVFTHGIACLVATKTVCFTDLEIDALLEETVREMLKGHLINGRNEI